MIYNSIIIRYNNVMVCLTYTEKKFSLLISSRGSLIKLKFHFRVTESTVSWISCKFFCVYFTLFALKQVFDSAERGSLSRCTKKRRSWSTRYKNLIHSHHLRARSRQYVQHWHKAQFSPWMRRSRSSHWRSYIRSSRRHDTNYTPIHYINFHKNSSHLLPFLIIIHLFSPQRTRFQFYFLFPIISCAKSSIKYSSLFFSYFCKTSQVF